MLHAVLISLVLAHAMRCTLHICVCPAPSGIFGACMSHALQLAAADSVQRIGQAQFSADALARSAEWPQLGSSVHTRERYLLLMLCARGVPVAHACVLSGGSKAALGHGLPSAEGAGKYASLSCTGSEHVAITCSPGHIHGTALLCRQLPACRARSRRLALYCTRAQAVVDGSAKGASERET